MLRLPVSLTLQSGLDSPLPIGVAGIVFLLKDGHRRPCPRERFEIPATSPAKPPQGRSSQKPSVPPMTRTISISTGIESQPARRVLLEIAYVAYFIVLLLAPVAVPPVVAEMVSSVTYAEAMVQVSTAVAIGYFLGLAALLRPV